MSLWNSTQKNCKIGSPQSRTHDKRPHSRETSLCVCQKASYTVEAVVVIPLMMAFLASILFFFRILYVQLTVEEALLYAGRKTAVESSAVSSQEMLLASAKGFFLYALQDNQVVEQYVQGGSLGILLIGSDCEGEDICLQASYEVTMPIAFWNIGQISLYSQNSFQKWNGDSTEEEQGDWVYVTANGTVYHESSVCRILDLSIREVVFSQIDEERGKDGQKYYACSRCCTKEASVSKVYCTDYGSIYHMDISCSHLKRTISKIDKAEVGEKQPCSFCSKED